ncbi:hypothetical protein NJC08_00520 [Pseudomonas fluorescens]|uniref:co-regulatory protein PtrA N-terminal domain-containing protein n=1 Tax=Pseudomonas fluorescens TaxID=294 RepID=UPI00209AAD7A|nr:co-regulatory protein PtrA N-terminal domain-containing protein [Pseudomonas fluorescens]MCO7624895.1 hypothetical protein [Pseudomonas fluorescens]
MNSSKVIALVIMFSVSSFALAEGGGDRTFARMMQANDAAMAKYEAKEKKSQPVSSDAKKDQATKNK